MTYNNGFGHPSFNGNFEKGFQAHKPKKTNSSSPPRLPFGPQP